MDATPPPMPPPVPVMPTDEPLGYAPPSLAGRRPPRWVGLACVAVAAVVLLADGLFGVLAGDQAVEARRRRGLDGGSVPRGRGRGRLHLSVRPDCDTLTPGVFAGG